MHGMKSKGFTLVEIIAVIALLAIVVTVVAINMVGVKTNTTEIETKRFKEKVTSSGCQYVDKATIDDEKLKLSSNTNCSDNSSLTSRNDCKNNSGGCYVCLKTLLEAGMIDRDTIDPNTDKKISDLNATEIAKYKVLVKWKTNSDGTKEKECSFIGPDDENPVIDVDIYKLMFNANGGSVSETVRNVKKGNQYGTLPVPTRGDDYNFLGWFTAASGGSKVSATTTMGSSDTTVYAHWKLKEYNLYFNTNGGKINDGNITSYTQGVGATLPTNVTKSGYTFDGWYSNSELTGNKVTQIGINESGNKTYWAKWVAVAPTTYTVTYKANNFIYGFVNGFAYNTTKDITYQGTNNNKVTPNIGYYLSSISCTSGYTASGTTGTSAINEQTITVTNNVKSDGACTINFAPRQFTVTLYNYAGNFKTVTATYESNMPSITIPKRTGYTFDGYYLGSDGTGMQYYDASGNSVRKYTHTSNITLYAKWISNQDNVTFSATNGSVTPTYKQIGYGNQETIKVTPNSGFFLASYTCDSGLTVSGINTGVQYKYTQTGTVKKTGTGSKDKNCKFVFSNWIDYKVSYDENTKFYPWYNTYMSVTLGTATFADKDGVVLCSDGHESSCDIFSGIIEASYNMNTQVYLLVQALDYFKSPNGTNYNENVYIDKVDCNGANLEYYDSAFSTPCSKNSLCDSPGVYQKGQKYKIIPTSNKVECNVTFSYGVTLSP